MTIEDTNSVDMVSLEDGTDRVLLTISDHLGWDHDDEADRHLLLLQEKVNAYLRFLEGGEFERKVPAAYGRIPVINLVCKYPLSREGEKFFELARRALYEAGFETRYKVL